MNKRFRCASIILILFAIGFFISGIVLLALNDSIIQKAVKKECQLRPGTTLYDSWLNSPVPLTISFYVFDLVNEKDFFNGAKPHLIQRGPFVYSEQRTKFNVKIYENHTISYRESRNFSFDRNRSSDDESLRINTINVVYMTLMNFLQRQNVPSYIRKILEGLLSVTEKATMQRTVREYLWGYEDPLLTSIQRLFPQLVSDNHISVFASVVEQAQYNTFLINDGIGLDASGHDRINQLGRIERFNGSANLSIWFNEYANMINGTDSTLWHPNVNKDESIYAYESDICRSMYVKYNQTYLNHYNINTYRFKLPNNTFAQTSENEGFCEREILSNGTKVLKCLPDGLLSMSPCLHLSGSSLPIPLPIVASNPHFLDADRRVQDAVVGLNPLDDVHRSFMDIEPLTGVIMNGSRRMQFNINVVNDSKITILSRLQSLVFPMMWVHEYAEIDQTNAEMFQKKVLTPIRILSVVKYLFLVLGIALFIAMIGLMVFSRYHTPSVPTVVVVDVNENAAGTPVSETTPLLE